MYDYEVGDFIHTARLERVLSGVFFILFTGLSLTFLLLGIAIYKRASVVMEENFKNQKNSLIFATVALSAPLTLLAAHLILKTVFYFQFMHFKADSIHENDYRYPLYEFF